MTDLIILLLLTVLLAWCADHMSWGPVRAGTRHRLVLGSVLITVLMAGFAGLRVRCNDTGAYRPGYELITSGSLDGMDLSVGSNPLFNLINYCLKMNDVSTQNYLMFWAVVTVAGYITFVHRHSVDYPLTIFLLFTTGCYTFAFAGIKQAAAVAVALIAVLFALRRRWILYVLCVLIAAGIHPYALMYLLVPLMTFRPWSRRTYLLLGLALLGGFLLRPLIGTLVDITTMMGEEYTVESFTQSGINVFRVLVCNVPLVLSFLYRKKLFRDSTQAEDLIVNLTMLNGAIMFVGLFGTANYFGRLANYFLIFQSLSLPWMLKKIGGRDGQILKVLLILGYVAYFWYANVINIPFDQDFARLTIRAYLALLGG